MDMTAQTSAAKQQWLRNLKPYESVAIFGCTLLISPMVVAFLAMAALFARR